MRGAILYFPGRQQKRVWPHCRATCNNVTVRSDGLCLVLASLVLFSSLALANEAGESVHVQRFNSKLRLRVFHAGDPSELTLIGTTPAPNGASITLPQDGQWMVQPTDPDLTPDQWAALISEIRQTAIPGLCLRGVRLDKRLLTQLAEFGQLKYLYLGWIALDTDYAQLAQMKSLEKLRLSYHRNRVTDAGMAYVATLHNLRVLILHGTGISETAAAHLGKLRQLRHLDMLGTEINDAALGHLKSLRCLESLRICGPFREEPPEEPIVPFVSDLDAEAPPIPPPDDMDVWPMFGAITDVGLEALGSMTSLKVLHIEQAKITDDGVYRLCQLPKLERLELHGCSKLTNASLRHIARLGRLRALAVLDARITDQGLSYLKEMKALQAIEIGGEITDSGLEHLAKIGTLTSLELDGCDITDKGLRHLADLRNLRTLSFSRCKRLRGSGLRHLNKLRQLESLSLYHSAFNDRSLGHLAGLERLKTLEIDRCLDLTREALGPIAELNTLERLYICDIRISDVDLQRVRRMKNLSELRLWATKVTRKGVESLRKARPDLIVNYRP